MKPWQKLWNEALIWIGILGTAIPAGIALLWAIAGTIAGDPPFAVYLRVVFAFSWVLGCIFVMAACDGLIIEQPAPPSLYPQRNPGEEEILTEASKEMAAKYAPDEAAWRAKVAVELAGAKAQNRPLAAWVRKSIGDGDERFR